MNCPVCISIPLVMTERSSVEIDYCPNCRGVWLDRGELDKIIDRSNQAAAPASPSIFTNQQLPEVRPSQTVSYPNPREANYDRDQDRDRAHPRYKHGDHDRDDYRHKKKKRGGFLEDLFDFD